MVAPLLTGVPLSLSARIANFPVNFRDHVVIAEIGATRTPPREHDLLARHGIECPMVTGAGTSTFEFETASGVYTELQCGSYIFMDAD